MSAATAAFAESGHGGEVGRPATPVLMPPEPNVLIVQSEIQCQPRFGHNARMTDKPVPPRPASRSL
jgi:hypothetical protein